MELQCPACGANLSRFDVDETGHCPTCGVAFSDEARPMEVEPPLPLCKSRPRWSGALKAILFAVILAVGFAMLALAFVWAQCSHGFRMNN
jgi:hypothetical protein